jgi:hypothetical protein
MRIKLLGSTIQRWRLGQLQFVWTKLWDNRCTQQQKRQMRVHEQEQEQERARVQQEHRSAVQQMEEVDNARKEQLIRTALRRIKLAALSQAYHSWRSSAHEQQRVKAVLRKAYVKLTQAKMTQAYDRWVAVWKVTKRRKWLMFRIQQNATRRDREVLDKSFELWVELWMDCIEQDHIVVLRAEMFRQHCETVWLRRAFIHWNGFVDGKMEELEKKQAKRDEDAKKAKAEAEAEEAKAKRVREGWEKFCWHMIARVKTRHQEEAKEEHALDTNKREDEAAGSALLRKLKNQKDAQREREERDQQGRGAKPKKVGIYAELDDSDDSDDEGGGIGRARRFQRQRLERMSTD